MKLINNVLVMIVVVMLTGVGYALWRNTQAREIKDELIVGTAAGYAPYVSLNEQGQYEGFDIDVAQEIGKRLNKKIQLKDCGSMVPLMLSLKQGSVDMLIWALEINQARQKEMRMIRYQGGDMNAYPLLFWKEIPAGITCLEDLKNYPEVEICVEPGSTQERFLNRFPFITKKPLEKVTDIVMDLKYGKSFAALVDPALVKELVRKSPELKIVWIPLPAEFRSYGNGICVKKENVKLAQNLETVIAAMQADGTIARLEQKWNIG